MKGDLAARDDEYWMRHALSLAEKAEQNGEVPVGAVIVCDGQVVGEGWNQSISLNDPSAHAEMQAMRAAALHQQNYRLSDCTLYVSLEPCMMCAGAMVHARIKRLVYATSEPRSGAIESALQLPDMQFLNHRVACHGGVLADESAALLQAFFRSRR